MSGNNSPQATTFNPRKNFLDQFWYGANTTGGIAAAANANLIINIDADADFYLTAMSYQADVALAALTESTNVIPLVTILITDSGSGKSLSNIAIPIPTIMGDGKRPYRLPYPRVFTTNSTIQLALANYSAATTYNLRIVLHGYKKYFTGG